MSMEDAGRSELSPGGPAPQAVTLTAGLAVAYARGEAVLDALFGAAGAASSGGPLLDWQHWGLLLARALEQVLHPLRPALSCTPAGGAAVEAAGPGGMLTGLTAAEAAELAARLRAAETSLRPMPAGTPEGFEQILAEVAGLREMADTQASRRAARARQGGESPAPAGLVPGRAGPEL